MVTSVEKKNIPTESALNNVLSSVSTTVPHPEQTSVNKQIPNSNLIDSTAGEFFCFYWLFYSFERA